MPLTDLSELQPRPDGTPCTASQIRRFLAAAIADGSLIAGERLPTVREMAARLAINYATVAQAWAEAKADGLIESRPGKGSFVRAAPPPPGPAPLESALLNSPFTTHSRALVDAMRAAAHRAIDSADFSDLLNYQPVGGSAAIVAAGLRWIQPRLPEARAGQLLPCAGIHGGLVALFSLLGPRGAVAVPTFFYPGIKAIAHQQGVALAEVACDRHGPLPEALEALCQRQPLAALYLNPNINNPTTLTLDLGRRLALVAVARRYRIAIIEDDAWGAMSSQRLPALASLYPERSWYLCGLSKSLAPGIRMAWVAAPSPADFGALAAVVNAQTLMPNPLVCSVVSRWINDGVADQAVAEMRLEARARYALAGHALAGRDYQSCPEGYHLWLWLGARDSRPLAAALQAQGIAALSASEFTLNPAPGPDAIRLCIGGNISREQCAERLALVTQLIDNPAPRSPVAI